DAVVQPLPSGAARLQRVVVGDDHEVDARGARGLGDLAHRRGAVGVGAVDMQHARDVEGGRPGYPRLMLLRRVAALAPVLVAVLAAALLLPHSPGELRDLVLATGAIAPAAALLAWVVLTPALFPGTVLAAAAGLTFGAPGGVAIAWGGAILGGLAAF